MGGGRPHDWQVVAWVEFIEPQLAHLTLNESPQLGLQRHSLPRTSAVDAPPAPSPRSKTKHPP